jgi:hypothetical protein
MFPQQNSVYRWLLGCCVVLFHRNWPTFRKWLLPSHKRTCPACSCIFTRLFMRGLLIDPTTVAVNHLWNASHLLRDYTAQCPRNSSPYSAMRSYSVTNSVGISLSSPSEIHTEPIGTSIKSLKSKLVYIIFKNSFRTSKRTQHFIHQDKDQLIHDVFGNSLCLFENHTKPITTKCSYWLLKQVGRIVTTRL